MTGIVDNYVLAIDPGDRHVGWAEYDTLDGEVVAGEWDSQEALGRARDKLRMGVIGCRRVTLVVEEFRLYEDKAMDQVGSAMETSQMIGALKYIAGQLEIEVVEQGATIKKSIKAQLPARGITRVGVGTHASDAELHLWYRLLKEKIWTNE